MIHLKKYNEAKQFSLYDSCKDVFAELLDDRLITLTDRKDSVLLLLGFQPDYKDGNFFNYLNMSEKWFESLKDIEVGYKRLRDEFGEINLYIYKERNYDRIGIVISKEMNYKNRLIQKICYNVTKYGGRLTVGDMDADSILYKQENNYYYYIEAFNRETVDSIGYDDNGNDAYGGSVGYYDLEIDILEEIEDIINNAIDDGLLQEDL